MDWETCIDQINRCQMCSLCKEIINKVPGQGDVHAPLMLIGEGPGQKEDEQGLAFVGPAGELLTKMLAAISLPRERVYICNVVKCHPPANRNPLPEEVSKCKLHLINQVSLVKPKVILLLGSVALKGLYGNDKGITKDRGKWMEKNGVWIMPTYHPSALLRDTSKKPDAWKDLQQVRKKLQELSLYTDIYGETNE